jgi:putative transposase
MAYSERFKQKIIKHIEKGVSRMSHIAKIRRVPRRTLYRWWYAHQRKGAEGLRNRKPGMAPRDINATFESKLLEYWRQRRRGAHKMWLDLRNEGFEVSERQLRKIYNKHGLKMNKRNRPKQVKFVRYEYDEPNELWHTDWSHCPFTGQWLIAFVDDYSRFLVHSELFAHATSGNTLLAFANAVSKYGVPKAVLTDQGSVFTPARGEKSAFTQWCEDHGIRHILGRVNHPQTNGKVERFFGTYKMEFKAGEDTLETFARFYNYERRHQALNYMTPSQRFMCDINSV